MSQGRREVSGGRYLGSSRVADELLQSLMEALHVPLSNMEVGR